MKLTLGIFLVATGICLVFGGVFFLVRTMIAPTVPVINRNREFMPLPLDCSVGEKIEYVHWSGPEMVGDGKDFPPTENRHSLFNVTYECTEGSNWVERSRYPNEASLLTRVVPE